MDSPERRSPTAPESKVGGIEEILSPSRKKIKEMLRLGT